MTYFHDLHTYLHQSSLLIQAYQQDTRVTTKYSLPQKPKPGKNDGTETEADGTARVKRDPAATLTLKTFHPGTGICLKYKTDKAAEVGRLMAGLGRLAKGEIIDLPTPEQTDNPIGARISVGAGEALSTGGPAQGDKMDVDSTPVAEAKTATQMTQSSQQTGGGKKKKKNKK